MKRKTAIVLIITLISFFASDNIVNWVMMRGINNYYGLNQKADILLVGHSHLMLATDKVRLEKELGLRISKYCREGVNVTDKKIMVEHFLNSGNSDSLKIALYGVDLATFTGDGLSQNSYKLFYPFMDNKHVGSYVLSQTTKADYWLHKLIKTTRFSDDGLKNAAARGWLDNWDNFKSNVINIDSYKKRLANGDERHIQMNEHLMTQFQETIKMMTDRGIKVILVNTPTLDLLNAFEPEKYSEVIEWFADYAEKNSLVEFIDFNPQYASDYEIFSDRLHLNRYGQEIITGELIQFLKRVE